MTRRSLAHEDGLQDFRFACKLFKAAPGMAFFAVFSLAIAIAANTTILA